MVYINSHSVSLRFEQLCYGRLVSEDACYLSSPYLSVSSRYVIFTQEATGRRKDIKLDVNTKISGPSCSKDRYLSELIKRSAH